MSLKMETEDTMRMGVEAIEYHAKQLRIAMIVKSQIHPEDPYADYKLCKADEKIGECRKELRSRGAIK